MPPSEAQRRANRKQDSERKRAPLWLEADDAKQLDKIKQKLRLPSRIATLRALMERAK